jgi:hypothetical protein
MVLLAGCTGGDGIGERPAPVPETTVATAPSTTTTTVPATTSTVDAAGAVSLRATSFTLPDLRSGGSGLRLLVRPMSPRFTVRRRGGGGAVTACPVAGESSPITPAACVDLGPNAGLELASTGGVELRATAGDATLDDVAVTYVAADRSTTIVTPARPAGACAARPCEVTFSLTPARPGPFALDARGRGGRPRLVLTSVARAGGSNRTLATVEGGGSLSIRATAEAGSELSLLHHEQGPDAAAPVTAEISWP